MKNQVPEEEKQKSMPIKKQSARKTIDGLNKNQKKKLREKKNTLMSQVKEILGADLNDVTVANSYEVADKWI